MRHLAFLLAACLLIPGLGLAAQSAPLGKEILFWSPQQQITGYRDIGALYPTRPIPASPRPFPLLPDVQDFSGFKYTHDGETRSIDEFMRDMNTAGLIMVKDGRVVLERYGLGNDEHSRWISFSVAKSVVSMLIGAAIKDGYISSVDDKVVDYLPALKGGAYEGVTVKNILQMASGVSWSEDYADPKSDVAVSPGGTLPLIKYLGALPKAAEPGERFNYNTGETNLAGAFLRAAIGNNLATYLAKKIWQPFGMEADASWLIEEPGGVEFGGCCINATLRDYARIGLFALRGGRLMNGEQVLPEHWMEDSIQPSVGSAGYGYYWWLKSAGVYAAEGVFGQMIWIDPEHNVVIAMHSAWPSAWDDGYEANALALFTALTRRFTDKR